MHTCCSPTLGGDRRSRSFTSRIDEVNCLCDSSSGTAVAAAYKCWEKRVSVWRLFILKRRCTSSIGRAFSMLAVLFGALGLKAGASATLLVEDPYGKRGF